MVAGDLERAEAIDLPSQPSDRHRNAGSTADAASGRRRNPPDRAVARDVFPRRIADPASVHWPNGESLSRPAAYTAGFFVFWMLGALSSTLTLFFARAEPAAAPVHAGAP